MLAAVAIGASFSTPDVAGAALQIELPYLGAIGTLIAAGLLATLVVRHDFIEKGVPARTGIYVVTMIGAFVTLYLVAFRAFAGSLAAQAFATAVVTALVVGVARELAMGLAQSRERTQRLTVLGRFSTQKNAGVLAQIITNSRRLPEAS